MALLHCNFFSDTLGIASSMDMILPELQAGAKKPPVLYLLHGHSGDHTSYQRRAAIERHVAPLGLAVVMPAVNKSFYADMLASDKYWSFVSEELPRLVSTLFNVSEKREDTFVVGISMGGYGSFKLALSQPERFSAAASLSGALDVAALMERNPGWERAFETIFEGPSSLRRSGSDLFQLAEKLAASKGKKPKLYFCCGTEDFLYRDNLKFKAHLEKLKVPFTYQEGPGNHEWDYWDMNLQKILAWLPLKGRKH